MELNGTDYPKNSLTHLPLPAWGNDWPEHLRTVRNAGNLKDLRTEHGRGRLAPPDENSLSAWANAVPRSTQLHRSRSFVAAPFPTSRRPPRRFFPDAAKGGTLLLPPRAKWESLFLSPPCERVARGGDGRSPDRHPHARIGTFSVTQRWFVPRADSDVSDRDTPVIWANFWEFGHSVDQEI